MKLERFRDLQFCPDRPDRTWPWEGPNFMVKVIMSSLGKDILRNNIKLIVRSLFDLVSENWCQQRRKELMRQQCILFVYPISTKNGQGKQIMLRQEFQLTMDCFSDLQMTSSTKHCMFTVLGRICWRNSNVWVTPCSILSSECGKYNSNITIDETTCKIPGYTI